MPRRQWAEQGGNDLDDLALGLLDEARVLLEGFDRFLFPIAFWVVLVGGARAVVHQVQAPGPPHLHHQGGPRARQAGDDGVRAPRRRGEG